VVGECPSVGLREEKKARGGVKEEKRKREEAERGRRRERRRKPQGGVAQQQTLPYAWPQVFMPRKTQNSRDPSNGITVHRTGPDYAGFLLTYETTTTHPVSAIRRGAGESLFSS
jgi:hypothetical protein